MDTDITRSYAVHAETIGGGRSEALTKQATIPFDSSPRQGDQLPGPADLLTTAFAACVLKNVERMAGILPFRFERAAIDVHSERQDSPPRMTLVRYRLEVVTDEPPERVDLLHRNIRRHGTVYNTLAAACDVDGDIVALQPRTTDLPGAHVSRRSPLTSTAEPHHVPSTYSFADQGVSTEVRLPARWPHRKSIVPDHHRWADSLHVGISRSVEGLSEFPVYRA